MKTIAAVVTAPFEADVREIEIDNPGPDDVLLRTEWSFISNGTERHVHRREFPTPPAEFPLVIGYQCAGTVERVGENVTGIRIGQTVFTRRNRVQGIANPIGGSHAARVVAAASTVISVPAGVSTRDAAALVVAQVGYNAASRIPEGAARRVLVIGDGLIGQLAAQAATARGWEVILAGHHESLLGIARGALPSLITLDTTACDAATEVARKKLGEVHGVIDCVGSSATMGDAVSAVRALGHLVIAGYWSPEQFFSVRSGFGKELTVHFPAGVRPERMTATLDMIGAGAIRIQPLITHEFPFGEFREACRLLGQGGGGCLGIAIRWSA